MAKKVVIIFRHPVDHAAIHRSGDLLPRMKIISTVKEIPEDHYNSEPFADLALNTHKAEFVKKFSEYRDVPFSYEIYNLE